MNINKIKFKKISLVSWIIFLVTLTIVLISLVPVLFPALLMKTFGNFEVQDGINSFEIGFLGIPLLVTNFILLGIVILYWKKYLPKKIVYSIKFIFNFEVPKYIAFFVITILLGIYIIFSVNELFDGYYFPDYEIRVKSWIDNYSLTEIGDWGLGNHLNIFLLNASFNIFGNDKVIPFITSISLPLLTYFTTFEITKKRFAGLIAFVIVLQSGVFLMYDTSVSYPNFWIVFYLLSIYLIYKNNGLTVLSYAVALLSKPLIAVYLPMSVFFIFRAEMTIKKKFCLIGLYAILISIIVLLLSFTDVSLFGRDQGEEIGSEFIHAEFNSHDFWAGFSALYSSLRLDGLILVFLLPLTIGLFIASKKGFLQADAILFFLMSIMLSAPIIQGFSDYINTSYRFIPFVVFFAIGVGLLFSKRVKPVL